MLSTYSSLHSFTLERGESLYLGSKLGEGGEGSVYALPSYPNLVAKIYLNPIDDVQVAKLRAICSMASPQLDSACAWPRSLIVRQNRVCGFTMPLLSGGTEIHELFGSASRKRLFPKADWSFLIHVSKNLAAAVEALHQHNIVVGDLNQRNTVVFPNGMVKLWDCDSFQIERSGNIFYCKVGVPEFTPPELQNCQSFDGVKRDFSHDRFSLAVMIFYILFMGRHPYSGDPVDSKIASYELQDAIKNRLFAYSPYSRKLGIAPPRNSPPVFELGEQLLPLFRQSFETNQRTTAGQWFAALNELSKQLGRCDINPGHVYPRSKSECPWCAYETNWKVVTFLPTACPPQYIRTFEFERFASDIRQAFFELPINIPTPEVTAGTNIGKPLPPVLTISEWLREDLRQSTLKLDALNATYQQLIESWVPNPRIAELQTQGRTLQESIALKEQSTKRLEQEILSLQEKRRAFEMPSDSQAVLQAAPNLLSKLPLYNQFRSSIRKSQEESLAQDLSNAEQALKQTSDQYWQEQLDLKYLYEEYKKAIAADEIRKEPHLKLLASAKDAVDAQLIEVGRIQAEMNAAEQLCDASKKKRKAIYEIRKLRYRDLLEQERLVTAELVNLKTVYSVSNSKKKFLAVERSYRKTQKRMIREMDDFKNRVKEHQLNKFLDQFQIQSARIPGITTNLIVTLRSHGIQTAADINRRQLTRINGFTDNRTTLLEMWRDQHARSFRWNPQHVITTSDLESVRQKLSPEFHLLEFTIRKAAKEIEGEYKWAYSTATKKLRRLSAIREQLRQAVADLQVAL